MSVLPGESPWRLSAKNFRSFRPDTLLKPALWSQILDDSRTLTVAGKKALSASVLGYAPMIYLTVTETVFVPQRDLKVTVYSPAFVLIDVTENLSAPVVSEGCLGSGKTAMSDQLEVLAVTCGSPSSPLKVTVSMAEPTLF
jgi:hypothetical protein